ncbi:MAG: Uma2 family endonuclease [Chloroflexota bacterium]
MAQVTRTKATDYFQLPQYKENNLIQLIAGEVIVGMPPIPKHQAIVREILVLLTLLARKLGGSAFDSPIEVYLDEDNVYQPDVLYLKPDSACEVGDKRLIGAPDLVVEVLSPSTAKHDRHHKYQAYEKHGISEYWIIDPVHETIEVWINSEANTFERLGAFDKADTFTSPTLNEKIEVAPLFVM